jgi:hypothetical protein
LEVHHCLFTIHAGDRHLVLASDGLLEKLSPAEICAVVTAVADGRPLPVEPQHQPEAIPLGPVDIPAAAPAAAGALPPGDQQQLTPSAPCRPKPGVVACEDCCGAEQRRAPRTAQQIAETLQQTAYDRTALDNIAIVVIPLQECVMQRGPLSVHIMGHYGRMLSQGLLLACHNPADNS